MDLCAAPGVKTTHLAQLAGGAAAVVAMDTHRGKLRLVRDNAERLGTPGIALVCGDGTQPPLAPGFDRVLVDAPCSGLGTMRRRPDLKWRVRPETPGRLAELQARLLRSAVELCKNDGVVVYSVCTFTPEETSSVVETCVKSLNVEFEDGPEWLAHWKTGPGQYRTTPLGGALDGFFLTRLRKRS